MRKKSGRSFVWLILIFACISVFFISRPASDTTVITTFSFVRYFDWDLHLSWAQAARQTILKYHQFPIWNPYRCGGAPLLGEPESDLLSFHFPLILFFGPATGYGMALILYIALGMYGFFQLARYFKISVSGSYLVAVSYMCSGLILIPFAKGAPNFMAAAYLPFVFRYLLEFAATKNIRYAMRSGGFAALMFLSGFHYIGIVILLYGMVSVYLIRKEKRIAMIIPSLLPVVFFAGFSAIKLFPVLESLNLRAVIDRGYPLSGFSLVRLLYALLWPIQNPEEFSRWGRDVPGFIYGVSYGLRENGTYIGILFLIFGCIGMLQKRPFSRLMTGIFCIFLWISFGYNIFPGVYTLVRAIPGFAYLEVAQRFRYIWMIPLAVWVGIGHDVLLRNIQVKMKHRDVVMRLFTVLCILGSAHVLLVNMQIFTHGFSIHRMSVGSSSPFSQHCSGDAQTKETYEYPLVAQGYGVNNCTENVLIMTHSTCSESGVYKGEVYAQQEGTIVHYSLTPNIIRVTVRPESADIITLNQNFDSGWWVAKHNIIERASNHDNLIAATVRAGDDDIVFFYLPVSVLAGGVISGLTLFAAWKIRNLFIS